MPVKCCESDRFADKVLVDNERHSIRQNVEPDALPDYRNLGVIVRALLLANAVALLAASLRAPRADDIAGQFIVIAYWVEPVLFASLAALFVARDALARLPYAASVGCTLALVAALTAAMSYFDVAPAQGRDYGDLAWRLLYALVLAGALTSYFRLRSRAFSPALLEARLQALQARIRPHFLFNSLNAVLSLIRSDPRRAEAALEDLAELFRNLMADNRQLTTLGEQIALCRQYLRLEQLRLGERLGIEWRLGPGVELALVPPMLLQPLIENAVYHGIEPGLGPGIIEIEAERAGEALRVRLTNPYFAEHQHRQGNRMALANIRERLQLHFDVEASLESQLSGGRYEIRMVMPWRTAP